MLSEQCSMSAGQEGDGEHGHGLWISVVLSQSSLWEKKMYTWLITYP